MRTRVTLLLSSVITACGSPAHRAALPSGEKAGYVAFEPPRFAWNAPLTVHVTEHATKDDRTATLSYWLDVCAREPDLLVVTHRDFRFIELMGKPASNPEFAAALKELAPLLSAIPRFVIDAHGAVLGVEGAGDLLARLAPLLPAAELDQLKQTLADPASMQAFSASATERWQVWVQAWLAVDPRSIKPSDVVGPHRVKLKRSAEGKDLPDPSGAGAKLDLNVELETDTEWPAIRPWTASSRRTLAVRLGGSTQKRSETHRYAFDWDAHPKAQPDCSPLPRSTKLDQP